MIVWRGLFVWSVIVYGWSYGMDGSLEYAWSWGRIIRLVFERWVMVLELKYGGERWIGAWCENE
jgi:hypothetical protein